MRFLKYFLGTGFYSGLIPKAPGTFGSLAALIIIFVLIHAQLFSLFFLFFLVSALLTFWVTPFFEEKFGDDAPQLVLDEWAGQSLTFIAISFSESLQTNISILLVGFLLFRFFDILKPLGINKIQKLKGGWGILMDDILAGFYALISLKTLIFIYSNYL